MCVRVFIAGDKGPSETVIDSIGMYRGILQGSRFRA